MPRHSVHYPYARRGSADCVAADERLSGWIHAADAMTALLCLVAVTIALSGGFRTHIGDWHFAMTSPARVLAWALAIGLVRHAKVRQRSAAQLAALVIGWARSAPVATSAIAVAATRPVIFAAGYLAVVMFGYAPGARPFHEFQNELLNLPLRWDAGWYLQIATGGYDFLARGRPELQQNIVFFPAYPLIVRAIAMLFGNSMGAYVIGATVVSLGMFLVGLVYLYRLAQEDIGAERAVTAVWLLAAYPFALFYGAIYTESLYLAGAVAAFWHFRKGELARAALWGLVVGLTRPNGFLLSVPLAIAWLERGSLRLRGAAMMPATLAAMAPVLGMAMFSVFVWRLSGSPFAWLSGHAAWGRHYQGLAHLLVDRYDFISTAGFGVYVAREPYDFVNALGVLFVLATAWPVGRRFGLAFATFILINILPPLAAGGLMSAGRLSSVLFPAFLWLAAVLSGRNATGWIATFAALQAFNAALFYTWRPMY